MNCHAGVNKYAVGEKYQENTPTRFHLGALLNSMRCTCARTHTHFPAVGHVLVHTSLELASARTHTPPYRSCWFRCRFKRGPVGGILL